MPAAITVKNIPDELYGKLKYSAEQHRRSVNSELISCLEQVLLPHRLEASDHIVAAQSIRKRFTSLKISASEIQDAKILGRS